MCSNTAGWSKNPTLRVTSQRQVDIHDESRSSKSHMLARCFAGMAKFRLPGSEKRNRCSEELTVERRTTCATRRQRWTSVGRSNLLVM